MKTYRNQGGKRKRSITEKNRMTKKKTLLSKIVKAKVSVDHQEEPERKLIMIK